MLVESGNIGGSCGTQKAKWHWMTWKWFLHNWPFVRGILCRWLVDSPHKRPVLQALMLSLLLVWTSYGTNSWVPALLAHGEGNPPVTGRFPSQRASNTDLDTFFAVRLNKLWNKQSSCRWFEMAWSSCDKIVMELNWHCIPRDFEISHGSRPSTWRPSH